MTSNTDSPSERRNGIVVSVIMLAGLIALAAFASARWSEEAVTQPETQSAVAERTILHALSQPVSWRMLDEPLDGFIKFMEKELRVHVILDIQRLEEQATAVDTPLQVDCADCSARACLERQLENLQLDWLVHHESLFITSVEHANEIMETKVYDVRDLIGRGSANGDSKTDAERLKTLIMDAGPGPWSDSTGEGGAISVFQSDDQIALIVTLHRRGHDRIESILKQLRSNGSHKTARHVSTFVAPLPESKPAPAGESARSRGFNVVPRRLTVPPDLISGNNRFAFELYSQLRQTHDGNVFLSPYSISSAMAMISAGAAKDTAAEIVNALHFPMDDITRHAGFDALRARMHHVNEQDGIVLRIASRMWGQQGGEILASFQETLRGYYDAKLVTLDFANRESARSTINAWGNEATSGLNPEMISPSGLPDGTGLIVANAIYFNGTWATPFETKRTNPEPFRTQGGQVTVPMMQMKEPHKYAEVDGIQILEKPYAGDRLSMLILLPPTQETSTAMVDSQLNAVKLEVWLKSLQTKEVNVFLPRFHLQSDVDLRRIFTTLGLSLPFSAKADFSRISSTQQFINLFKHNAVVDVTEEGTEAAAVTHGGFGGLPKDPPPEFRADHPFVFLIRDSATGSILFLGRLSRPDAIPNH